MAGRGGARARRRAPRLGDLHRPATTPTPRPTADPGSVTSIDETETRSSEGANDAGTATSTATDEATATTSATDEVTASSTATDEATATTSATDEVTASSTATDEASSHHERDRRGDDADHRRDRDRRGNRNLEPEPADDLGGRGHDCRQHRRSGRRRGGGGSARTPRQQSDRPPATPASSCFTAFLVRRSTCTWTDERSPPDSSAGSIAGPMAIGTGAHEVTLYPAMDLAPANRIRSRRRADLHPSRLDRLAGRLGRRPPRRVGRVRAVTVLRVVGDGRSRQWVEWSSGT